MKIYLQKYHIFLSFATVIFVLYACSTTKKVPDGEYLLTKNKLIFEDEKIFEDELEDYISQKPNKKVLFTLPVGLWLYNLANPKYDSILTEYFTYPSNMRDQDLRDSLFVKYGHPEYVGKGLGLNKFLHNVGTAPVILEEAKTEASAERMREGLVYRGYWDSDVRFNHDLDSAAKKAQANYLITHKDPTYISEYYYDIPDSGIKSVYERDLNKSLIRSQQVLDQTVLEDEVRRINNLMRENGYYRFNESNEEIYFTADTLDSRKQVPVTMDIHKDSLDTPYKRATIGNITVAVVDDAQDFPKNITIKDSLRGINFHKMDNRYKTAALWRAIISRNGEVYDQKTLDLSKRNISAMNNFSILKARDSLRRGGGMAPNDSIIDVLYVLKPLDKFQLKVGADLNWSQLLSISGGPSVDFTTRNVFGGAENLNTTISGVFGSVVNPRDTDKRLFAHELSAQFNLSFPRLLLPFSYWRLIPKRYSPTSSISLGVSDQRNIGLGRTTFNTSLNYFANVNDISTHRLTVFNTELSLTKNSDKYYDFFTAEADARNEIFQLYSPSLYQQLIDNQITSDQFTQMVISDENFVNSLSGANLVSYNEFLQSLINKDRQTQNVFISSLIYNFIYNEIGKKDYKNPFYFNGKIESAGNIISLINPKNTKSGFTTGEQGTVLGAPYAQFVKFDFDVRKYFELGKPTLALRQFIGLGIPYGNSNAMPFIRSYFNGGANDIRAWTAFGGLGPADIQLDRRIRTYMMENVKLTTSVEYRYPFNDTYEAGIFADAGNIWSLKENELGTKFKFDKFISQMGLGAGLGLRAHIAYITVRVDLAYKLHDPNQPMGERWRFNKFQPLKPTLNIAFGYPF